MTKPLILYIDDTDADIELLRALLGQRGIGVAGAHSGKEGMADYNPREHVAVVIDWNLPDMDGAEAAKALLSSHPSCPIAFISGQFEKEHIATATALGIGRCFQKNMSLEHIGRISQFVNDCTAQHMRRMV